MKKNFKPNTWLYPQPVLVIASYGADGTADGMVAAWGGIYDTNQVGFMLDHTHKTVANLLEKKAFTVSMATVSTMAEADYLGIVSGNRVPDKVVRECEGSVPVVGKVVRRHPSHRFFTPCHIAALLLFHKAFLRPFRMTIGGRG